METATLEPFHHCLKLFVFSSPINCHFKCPGQVYLFFNGGSKSQLRVILRIWMETRLVVVAGCSFNFFVMKKEDVLNCGLPRQIDLLTKYS